MINDNFLAQLIPGYNSTLTKSRTQSQNEAINKPINEGIKKLNELKTQFAELIAELTQIENSLTTAKFLNYDLKKDLFYLKIDFSQLKSQFYHTADEFATYQSHAIPHDAPLDEVPDNRHEREALTHAIKAHQYIIRLTQYLK